MKKTIKYFVSSFVIIFTLIIVYIGYILEPSYHEQLQFINFPQKQSMIFYSSDGKILTQNNYITFDELPADLINAFLSIEDKNFFSHDGIDYARILKSLFINIKNWNFKQGGSTITQQLIKNTQLSNKKTINRKIKELRLAKLAERKLNKKQIFEYYVNSLYYAPKVYGIANASNYFFNKDIKNISLAEAAILAGIINNPKLYSPINNFENCNCRKNLILNLMLKNNYITKEQCEKAKNEKIKIYGDKTLVNNFNINCELNKLLEKNNIKNPKSIIIKTTIITKLQKILENAVESFFDPNFIFKSVLIENATGKIVANYATELDNIKRQVGSTIKPILCYASNLEYNNIDICTPLKDEKIKLEGYEPKNYKNKYNGYISAIDALKKSSNVCAVRLLNYLDIDKAKKFANNNGLNFDNNDNNLSLALGTKEFTLEEITNTYLPFANFGKFIKSYSIDNIIVDNKIYHQQIEKKQSMRKDTAALMNIMLKECVNDGTARKLKSLYLDIAAKTGTVGNNNGNTDAYCIAYTKKYTLGVWVGTKNYETRDKKLTGSNISCKIAYKIFDKLYKNIKNLPLDVESNIVKTRINSYELKNNQRIVLENSNNKNNSQETYLAKHKIKNYTY